MSNNSHGCMSEKSPEFHSSGKKIITTKNLTEKNVKEYLLQNLGNTKLPEEKFNKLVRELEQTLKQRNLNKKGVQDVCNKSLEKLKIEADLQRLENLLKDCESNFNEINKARNSAGVTDKFFDFLTGSQVDKTTTEAYNNTRNIFIATYSKYIGKLKSDKIKPTSEQRRQLEIIMNKGSLIVQTKLESPSFTDMTINQLKNTKKQTVGVVNNLGKKIDKLKGNEATPKTVVIEHENSDVLREIRYASGDYEIVLHDGTRQITYSSGLGNIECMIIYADGRKIVRYRTGKVLDASFSQEGVIKVDAYRKSAQTNTADDKKQKSPTDDSLEQGHPEKKSSQDSYVYNNPKNISTDTINKLKNNERAFSVKGDIVEKINNDTCKIIFNGSKEILCKPNEVKNVLEAGHFFSTLGLGFIIDDFAKDKNSLKGELIQKISLNQHDTLFNIKDGLSSKEITSILNSLGKSIFGNEFKSSSDVVNLERFFIQKKDISGEGSLQDNLVSKKIIIGSVYNQENLLKLIK